MNMPRRTLERGGLLALLAVTAAATAIAATTGWGIVSEASRDTAAGERLRLPPLTASARDGDPRVFDLAAQSGRSVIVSSGEAGTSGCNARLGLTLDVRNGGARVQQMIEPDGVSSAS